MEVEMFAICDAATDQRGHLNVLGAFDTFSASMPPVVRERSTVVARLRYGTGEGGSYHVALHFLDEDGKRIIPEMKAKYSVKIPSTRGSSVVNLVMHISRLKFDRFGEYEIALFHNNEKVKTLPLYVSCSSRGRPRNRMNN